MSISWKKVLITWLKHHESHEICAFVFKYNSYSHFSTSSISSDVLVLFILKTIFRRIPDGLRGGILFQWFQKPTHLWSSLNFKRSIIYMTPNHFNKKMEISILNGDQNGQKSNFNCSSLHFNHQPAIQFIFSEPFTC